MVSETALSCSESPGSFLLLRRLPRKETRSRAAHFFSKDGLCFNCSVWLSLFFTSEARMAHRALLLNFLFRLSTRGPQVKAEMIHLLAFRKGKGPAIYSPGTRVYSEEPAETSNSTTHLPERNSFILQPTVHIRSGSRSCGR